MVLIKKNWRTMLFTLILIWATVFFYLMNPTQTINYLIVFLSCVSLVFVFLRSLNIAILFYIYFLSINVCYGYILINNSPIWIIMILFLGLNYFFMVNVGQISKLQSHDKRIAIAVYSLIMLEVFYLLGYFILSPMNRSLLIVLVLYLIYGYNEQVVEKRFLAGFYRYLLVFFVIFVTIVLSASWGKI